MSKVKRIRNFKNTIENALFISVVLTVGSIVMTLLYTVLNILNAAVFTANMWGILLITDVLLFTAKQFCDIWIWSVKTKKKVKPSIVIKSFYQSFAH